MMLMPMMNGQIGKIISVWNTNVMLSRSNYCVVIVSASIAFSTARSLPKQFCDGKSIVYHRFLLTK